MGKTSENNNIIVGMLLQLFTFLVHFLWQTCKITLPPAVKHCESLKKKQKQFKKFNTDNLISNY